jgi:Bacterial Ig-like domain (group 2)
LRLGILTALLAGGAWAQTVAVVYVAAPQVRVISGDSEQLSAVGRDSTGNAVNTSSITWSSNNKAVINVDSSGMVTAGALGIADVTATINGRQGILRLQVLPKRIDVTPANQAIKFGTQQQFSAVAYDSHDQPITSATFAWHILVAGGSFDSTTVHITTDGVMNATTLGYYVARASVVYNQGADQFEREFDGSTTFQIVSMDYKVTTLASSRLAYPSFRLRGKRSTIAANDSGQVVFSGTLDGLTGGLFTWQSPANLSVLATAGTPGVQQSTVFYDFDNASIDSSGNVLATASMIAASSNVVIANANGFQTVLTDRQAADAVLDVTNLSTNRYSLSDSGDIVVRGNFHYDGSTANYTGLLRYSGVTLILEASSKDPLPGLTGTVSFDSQFGLDNAGILYFAASGNSGRAIFRKEPFKAAVKVVAQGDSVGGVAITSVRDIAVAASDLIVTVNLADGGQALLRYPGGATDAVPIVMKTSTGYINQIYNANSKGGVVWQGDSGSGIGIYLWDGKSASSKLVLQRFSPSPTGEPVADFYSAAVDGAGNVYAAVRGVDTAWMLVRLGSAPLLVASDGTQIATTANLDLNSQVVAGDRTGPMHVLAGGNQPSLFVGGSQGLLPFLIVGDKLPGGSTYTGNFTSRKAPSGDLYSVTDSGLFRMSPTAQSVVTAFPLALSDGVNFNSPYNIAVNDHGQVAMLAGTDHSHNRLVLTDGKTTQTLAFVNAGAPYLTPSPAGGTFSNINDMVLNESGHLLASITVNGGPSGLFYFDGTAWQTVCSLDKCKLDGEAIVSFGQLRVANDKFCAVFSTAATNTRLDCWENGTWTNILKRGDFTSDGTDITFVYSTFDINRAGQAAVILNTNLGGPSAFLKDPNGYYTIQSAVFPPGDTTALIGLYSVDLRDDRRVFLIGQTDAGLMTAYEADPQF